MKEKRIAEIPLPDGKKVIITDKSHPKNVKAFQKFFEQLNKEGEKRADNK
jgi:hypothetical protein